MGAMRLFYGGRRHHGHRHHFRYGREKFMNRRRGGYSSYGDRDYQQY